jgi:hypothetical protein
LDSNSIDEFGQFRLPFVETLVGFIQFHNGLGPGFGVSPQGPQGDDKRQRNGGRHGREHRQRWPAPRPLDRLLERGSRPGPNRHAAQEPPQIVQLVGMQ